MPKIRATDFNIQTGNVASVTVVLPPHEIGDVLLVFAGKDDATGSGPTTATTGWLVGGSGVSGGATTAAVRSGWFVKRATTDAESDLVITSSDADTWSIIAMSIRGAGPSKIITNASWAASVSTFTITGHGYTTGAIVQIEDVTPSGYNGIYKVASTPTADTFTVADAVDPGTYTSGGTCYCLIDNHTGNGSTDATGAPYSVTGLTTNYDKSLVFFACLSGATGTPVHYPGLQRVDNVDSGAEGLGVAYMVKRTAGATGNKDFYADSLNVNTIGFCVAVRDDGTGQEAPYWDIDYATLLHPFRGSSTIITGDVWGTALTNYPSGGKDAVAACFQVDQSGGPSFVDYTTAANNATDADVIPYPATEVAGAEGTGDWFAIGYSKPFMSLLFDRAGCTAGAAGVVVWEYWNGEAWIALTSVTDATTSFTSVVADSQQVRWAMPPNFNWATRTLNSSASLYYVRARCTTVWTTNPTISQVYVGGLPLLYDAVGASTDAGVIQFENASNVTAATSGIQAGGVYIDLGSTVSLTGKIIVGTYQFTLPRDYVDSARFKEGGGVHIWLADTSFNRKSWCIGSYKDRYTNDAQRNRFAIDWAQATDTTHSKTTTTPSDTIADIGIAHLAPRGAGSVAFSQMIAIDPTNAVLNGGSSTTPITLDEFLALGDASPIQIFRDGIIMIPVIFGGSDSMHYALDGFTLSFPGIATPWTDPYNILPSSSAHYDSGVLGFTLDARSGDTLKMTNGKISSISTWKFNVASTASSGASWDFSNLLLINANVTLRAVYTWADITFQDCPSFTQNSAVIDACFFIDTKITSNAPNLISNSSFSLSTTENTGHGLELTTSGTYAFTGNTFTGYGPTVFGFHTTNDVDAGTDVVTETNHGYNTGDAIEYRKQGGSAAIGLTDVTTYYVRAVSANTIAFYTTQADAIADTSRIALTSTGTDTHYINSLKAAIYNNSSGLVTLNITDGDTPSIRNGAGATTTVNNAVSLTITVKNSLGVAIENARVAIFTDDTGEVELMNELTNASGIAIETYSYTTDISVFIRVRSASGVPAYQDVETSGLITSGGLNAQITMQVDTNV